MAFFEWIAQCTAVFLCTLSCIDVLDPNVSKRRAGSALNFHKVRLENISKKIYLSGLITII